MKRTLERITRKILPLVVAANIAPAINSEVSYGQECGESFETLNKIRAPVEYTFNCGIDKSGKGKWTYPDKDGNVKPSDDQAYVQGQYNQEVKGKGAQPGKTAELPPVPSGQVVPLEPAAPSSSEQSNKVDPEVAAAQERAKAAELADAARKRIEAEQGKGVSPAPAVGSEKKKEEEKSEADRLAKEKSDADKKVAYKLAAEKSSSSSEDKESGKSIYDYAVDTPKANIYSERKFVNLNLAGEYGSFVKDKRENTVKDVASAFASVEFGRFFSIGPFVRIYNGEIKNSGSSSKTLSSQRELVGPGIYRQATNDVKKTIDREYSSLEAGLGATVETDNLRFVFRLGGIERDETTKRNYNVKVQITDSNNNPIGSTLNSKKTTYENKKETAATGEVGIEYKFGKGISFGIGAHAIDGEDIRGKLSLNYKF